MDAATVLFSILVISSVAQSRIITLDVGSDQTSEFLEITCHYANSYSDFWVYGCEANPSPANEDGVGFWTACGKPCHFIYNTGILPRPLNITVEGYLSSPAIVALEGARSVYNTSDWTDIGQIEDVGWFTYNMDMGAVGDSHVFSISPIPSTGLVLIDKIVIDLGPDIPDTTTRPPSTTAPPTGYVILDKLNDHPKYYTNRCHYSVGFEDFESAWGCPTAVAAVSEFESEGFWSSCQREYCSIDYYGRIDAQPLNIRMFGYIKGGAAINVYGGPSTLNRGRFLYRIDAGSYDYCNSIVGIELEEFADVHAISVELVSAPDGFVLLDGLIVQFEGLTGPEFKSSIEGDISCRLSREQVTTTTRTTAPPTTTASPTTTAATTTTDAATTTAATTTTAAATTPDATTTTAATTTSDAESKIISFGLMSFALLIHLSIN